MTSGCIEDLLNAVNVGSERCDDNLPRGLGKNLIENRTDLTLRGNEARNFRVGRVHHEQIDAFFTEAGERTQVREAMVQGKLVHLEIAGDQDFSGGSAHEECKSVRNRVRDGDEFTVERTDRLTIPFGDNAQVIGAETMLAKLGFNESQSQI